MSLCPRHPVRRRRVAGAEEHLRQQGLPLGHGHEALEVARAERRTRLSEAAAVGVEEGRGGGEGKVRERLPRGNARRPRPEIRWARLNLDPAGNGS